ncbi:guanine nucleotide-binding protein subunit alpha-1-like [Biomphalaria glabrata]|uniref:Guanine nucleotide-binding protein subunit alpha-1-like n=1 Tax=Biomphalaria glabrata TaxID=6526 RepID=A0A9W3ARY2_BIOGL|nr:guanine nucleotide-binding protein subunit alpha-1-like [Biomphalaria glabrata]KAI8742506.1 hypothetical protein BgiMline_022279 [Biomphalaria glabrata]
MEQNRRVVNNTNNNRINEREPAPAQPADTAVPSAPKKRKSDQGPTPSLKPKGLPRPFDYLNKPASARKLFFDPPPASAPLPDYSRLPVPPVPSGRRSHRVRAVSRLREGHTLIKKRLFNNG